MGGGSKETKEKVSSDEKDNYDAKWSSHSVGKYIIAQSLDRRSRKTGWESSSTGYGPIYLNYKQHSVASYDLLGINEVKTLRHRCWLLKLPCMKSISGGVSWENQSDNYKRNANSLNLISNIALLRWNSQGCLVKQDNCQFNGQNSLEKKSGIYMKRDINKFNEKTS